MSAMLMAQTDVPKIFQDSALDMTFSYPAFFTTVPSKTPTGQSQCVKALLSAGSAGTLGSSAFVISKIDGTCPGVLKEAQDAAAFTREQIVRQLKSYGVARLTQEPFRYSVDGRSAAMTLAEAHPDASAGADAPVTYAAKACFLQDLPQQDTHKSRKRGEVRSNEVICLDFTTQNRELLTRILSFTVQFGVDAPRPLVPGNALR
jgi:hypothetical protein